MQRLCVCDGAKASTLSVGEKKVLHAAGSLSDRDGPKYMYIYIYLHIFILCSLCVSVFLRCLPVFVAGPVLYVAGPVLYVAGPVLYVAGTALLYIFDSPGT